MCQLYKRTGKVTKANLKQAGLSEIVDIAGDLTTIFDGGATIGDKIKARIDLIAGTELNNKGQKAVKELLGITKKSQNGAESGKKTYQTYIKINPKTGEIYCGRTSGTGSLNQNVLNRDKNHHMNKKGFGPAILDESSDNPDAIRSQEQYLIDIFGGAKSKGGTSGNSINGISPNNSKINDSERARRKEFGD